MNTGLPEFTSPAELGRTLTDLANRLHHINRVSIEITFDWHLADLLRAAGDLTELMTDKDTERLFGTGYTASTLPRDAQCDDTTALLGERMCR